MSKKKNERKQRKKNRALRPWCWYCEREFEDEKVLMQHQKAKHFKCNQCPRRLNTAGGLAVHIQQVHKLEPDQLPKIDNALPGRDGYEVEIFGMEGIPAPDVADYKRRKEVELGLSAGTITQPPNKRPRTENKVISQAELKVQLEAHKALMGAADIVPMPADVTSSAAVYNAEPQAYSAPAAPLPGMPPFPPGGFPPPGMPGAPPFPPMPGMQFPGPPLPGFPGFPPPPGMGDMAPPGFMPPFAPNGVPPPGMMPFPPNPNQPPGHPTMGGPPQMPPSFVPASLPPSSGDQAFQQPPASFPASESPVPKSPPRDYPPSNYTHHAPKAGTVLIWSDANLSPEESRVDSDPKYQVQLDLDLSRGTKRARAEDFL